MTEPNFREGGRGHFASIVDRIRLGEAKALEEFKSAVRDGGEERLTHACHIIARSAMVKKAGRQLDISELSEGASKSTGAGLLTEAVRFISECRLERKVAKAEGIRDAILAGEQVPAGKFDAALTAVTDFAEKTGLYKNNLSYQLAIRIRDPINSFIKGRMKEQGRCSFTGYEQALWEAGRMSVLRLVNREMADTTREVEQMIRDGTARSVRPRD